MPVSLALSRSRGYIFTWNARLLLLLGLLPPPPASKAGAPIVNSLPPTPFVLSVFCVAPCFPTDASPGQAGCVVPLASASPWLVPRSDTFSSFATHPRWGLNYHNFVLFILKKEDNFSVETQQFYRPLLCEISWCLLPQRVTPAPFALHILTLLLLLLTKMSHLCIRIVRSLRDG